MEDCVNILKKMKEFKLYMVEFFENGAMKFKVYFFSCVVKGEND